jgi:hypothetical protein
VDIPLLDQLREINAEVRTRYLDVHGRAETLDRIGLILDDELDDHRYDQCTPLNCRTFAGTGGDGVHFSLLVINGEITEKSPVVMTKPSDGWQSFILGESLRDFLNLGCELGYFSLESIVYEDGNTLAAYTDERAEMRAELLDDETKNEILALLRQRLQPWTDSNRLAELQRRFMPLLRLPPDASDI